jgi:hypothetical protein
MSRGQIGDRLASRAWQVLLPGVYLAWPGSPTRRQMMIGALLWAGPDAAIDGVDACRFHGIKAAAIDESRVHVLVPWGSPARGRGFVTVRRTVRPPAVVHTQRLRYVDAATAVIAAARLSRSDRAALALVCDAVQRRITSPKALMLAHVAGPPKNARRTDEALAQLIAGVRSAAEADFRCLAEASSTLPPFLYNRLLRLPSGVLVSPDALAPDAPLIHETNGRRAHEREDLFADMQLRHEVLTGFGFTVFHSPPRRLALHGAEVIRAVERTYVRLAGTGWPHGCVLRQSTRTRWPSEHALACSGGHDLEANVSRGGGWRAGRTRPGRGPPVPGPSCRGSGSSPCRRRVTRSRR